jgi:phosphate starvation-inducible protein PhoH and related proteins
MSHKKRSTQKSGTRKVSDKLQTVNEEKKDTSPYVAQREKIDFNFNIRELPWTDKQKEIIELFLNKKAKLMLLKGPAGTSKTMLSMYLGLTLLNQRKVSDIVLVRSAVESADSKMGYLPGDLSEKIQVYLTPFNDKFNELISEADNKRLDKDNRIKICPINFARGLHFAVKFICCDEAQNLTLREIHTLMSRMGEFSKMIIAGDAEQSDLPFGKSGFSAVYDSFNNEESVENGIYCVELTEDDIVRSEFVKFITKKFKELKTLQHK